MTTESPFSAPTSRQEVERRSYVLLGQEEAAAALNVSVDTIRRRRKRGDLYSEEVPIPSGCKWLVAVPREAAEHLVAGGVDKTLQQEVDELRQRVSALERALVEMFGRR